MEQLELLRVQCQRDNYSPSCSCAGVNWPQNCWLYLRCKTFRTFVLMAVACTAQNIDDCWALGRFPNGTVYADPASFPSGMAALANYVHSLGLKIGLYSDAGNFTWCVCSCGICSPACSAGRPGSLGYEKTDAMTYASWGFDYLVCRASGKE